MDIETMRFGRLSVPKERIVTFPRGILGFPELTRYAQIPIGHEYRYFWLQCVDDPDIAFLVTDPGHFYRDYQVPLREETRRDLQMTDAGFAQNIVICNKVGDWLTANLQGPVVINAENRLAAQIVLTERKWKTRQRLMQLLTELPLAKSA